MAQDQIPFTPPAHRFGFFVGVDRCIPTISMRSSADRPPALNDSVTVSVRPGFGFSMGVLYEHPFNERFSVRAMPSLNFFDASVDYGYPDGYSEREQWESAEVGLSVQAVGLAGANGRGPYLALGSAVKYDVARETTFNGPRWSVDGAVGFRMRVSTFFVAPELRYSHSFTDLATDQRPLHTQVVDELYGHVLSLAVVIQD